MSIELNQVEYCKYNVKYNANADLIRSKRDEIAGKFKQANVPGFRQGKTPLDVIKFHFKEQINNALTQEMLQVAFEDTLNEKVQPFGEPNFSHIKLDNNYFECEFTLHTIPEFELKEYKNFNIPKANLPDSVEMGEKILQELRVQNGEETPYDDNEFSQNGDKIIINYKCYLNDTNEIVSEKDGELLTVGKSDIIALNENLLGMKIGETREFVSFVPASVSPNLTDKPIKFVVELVAGSKSSPAALDDQLALKVGAKNIDELKNLSYSLASTRVETLNKSHLLEQVSLRLVNNHNIQIPDWMLLFEARSLANSRNQNWETLSDVDKEKYLELSEKTVKVSLILNKVREIEPDAQLTDEEVMKILNKKMNEAYPSEEDRNKVLTALLNSGQIKVMFSSIRDEFVLDFIVKNSTIID